MLADRDRFRRLRVGRGQGSFYLTEGDDQPLEIRPEVLPYGEPGTSGAPAPFAESPYLHWFAREVQAAATAILLDEPYPPTDATEDDAWERPHRPLADGAAPDEEVASDPLLVLLASELRGEVGRQLRAVLERASPRQRQLLELMAYGATAAEAARALGIAEATARVQLKRLRDKAM